MPKLTSKRESLQHTEDQIRKEGDEGNGELDTNVIHEDIEEGNLSDDVASCDGIDHALESTTP